MDNKIGNITEVLNQVTKIKLPLPSGSVEVETDNQTMEKTIAGSLVLSLLAFTTYQFVKLFKERKEDKKQEDLP
ncbi:Uncharacterised protein [Plesiomonas shigelloides]|uniref:hypothetical protein n=1 Tax=Plesiomonas shigelloides TaxID=703 RepID=UPI000DFD1A21|nr:hypothetical protein [Plesiomonas shigelloides]SUC49268.1 Uncharacterised protein [Plesiomonas shigelloides]